MLPLTVIPAQAGIQNGNAKDRHTAGRVFEWYGQSGGQLKYYPLADTATWASARFRLEPLPDDLPHGILAKAQAYFPQLWPAADD